MPEIKVTISKDFSEKLDRAAKRWPFRMWKAVRGATRYAQRRAIKRTSGPKLTKRFQHGGQTVMRSLGSSSWVLRVRTGALWSSISPFYRRKGDERFEAGLTARPFYAAIHELGKRPFLKPSVLEAVEKLVKEIEVWE